MESGVGIISAINFLGNLCCNYYNHNVLFDNYKQ